MSEDLTLAEISSEVIEIINNNFSQVEDAVNAKADLHGDAEEVFNVAEAVELTQAINKSQLDRSVLAINTNIAELKTETNAGLATKVDTSDQTVTKQGNAFNGASQLVQLNAGGQLPAIDGSLLMGLTQTVPANKVLNVPEEYTDIQAALNFLNGKTLLGSITIQVADGIHTAKFSINHPQSNFISVLGNITTPDNCVINVTGANTAISVLRNNSLTINGFRVMGDRTSGSFGISARKNSRVQLGSAMIIRDFDQNLYVSINSSMYATAGLISKNAKTLNLYCSTGSIADFQSCSFLGYSPTKTSYGVYCSTRGFINIDGSEITDSTIGLYANDGGQVTQNGVTYTNCTTEMSPALNTLGNGNAYIGN